MSDISPLAGAQPAPQATRLILVDPVNPPSLPLASGVHARKAELRQLVNKAIDELWPELYPLLTPNGSIAGNANYAHAIASYLVWQSNKEVFTKHDAKCLEIWNLIHESMKKRLGHDAFDGGFIRSGASQV